MANKTRALLLFQKNPDGLVYRPGEEALKRLLEESDLNITMDKDDLDSCQYVITTSPHRLRKIKGDIKGQKVIAFALLDSKGDTFVSREEEPELRSLKNYDKADLVLSQTHAEKEYLEKEGVIAPIAIFPLIRPLDIKGKTPALERPVVLRHFGFDSAKPLYVLFGLYQDHDCMKEVEGLARIVPNSQFLFFALKPKSEKTPIHYSNKAKINNLVYSEEIRPEFYRSAILNAKAIVIMDPWLGDPSLLIDAAYSKKPIISVHLPLLEGLLVPGKAYREYKPGVINLYEELKDVETGKYKEPDSAYEKALWGKAKDFGWKEIENMID